MGKLQQTVSALNDADQLRGLIDTGEKIRSVAQNEDARNYLTTLHVAHRMADSLQEQFPSIDLRAERARLNALDEQLLRHAGQAVKALGGMQAFIDLRAQFNAGPDDRWWRLDDRIAWEKRQRLNRVGVLAGILAVLAIVVFLARDILFPYNPVSDAVNAAGVKIDAQDMPAALIEIDAGLQKVPTSTELLIWKGILLELSGDVPGATNAYTQARSLARNDAEFYLTRAQAYLRIGQYDQVIKDANALLASNPDSAEALYIRATGHEGKGDRVNAMTDLDKSGELAQKAGNDALYAMARYRYAMLMQSVSGPTATP